MPKTSTSSNKTPISDEEKCDYNVLLNELDALRLLLLDIDTSNQSSSPTKKPSNTPNYRDLANFFRNFLANDNDREFKKLLANNALLVNKISKLNGFHGSLQRDRSGKLAIGLSIRSLKEKINKNLLLISEARAYETRYLTAENIQPILEPIQQLNCGIDYLSKGAKEKLEEATQRVTSPFRRQLSTIASLTKTPKGTFPTEGEQLNKRSYLRLEKKARAFEDAGQQSFFENLPITLHQISQDFFMLLAPEKKEGAIKELEKLLSDSALQNYIDILKQFESKYESIKPEPELAVQERLNESNEDHSDDGVIFEESLKPYFPIIFTIKMKHSLRALGIIEPIDKECEQYSSASSQPEKKEEIIGDIEKSENSADSEEHINISNQVKNGNESIKTTPESTLQKKLIELKKTYDCIHEILKNSSEISFIPLTFLQNALTIRKNSIEEELEPYRNFILFLESYVGITKGFIDKIQAFLNKHCTEKNIKEKKFNSRGQKFYTLISLYPKIDQANYLIADIKNFLIAPYSLSLVELECFKRESLSKIRAIVEFSCTQMKKIDATPETDYKINEMPHLNFRSAEDARRLTCDVNNNGLSSPSHHMKKSFS